jgi:hypothetical protein
VVNIPLNDREYSELQAAAQVLEQARVGIGT